MQDLNFIKPTIVEKASDKKPGVLMTVGGVFQRADTKNANQRVYPKQLWNKVLQSEDVKQRLQNRQMYGMLGHPASGKTDPEKISHIVTKQELRSDGTIYGEADILDTPTGRIASTLIDAGAVLGISSRGDGTVEKKGSHTEVQDDYKLETYDFVIKPSTPGAFPGIVEGEQEENEKLIANAIDGLVESDLPHDQRVKVLTECLKILSVLEATNTGDSVQKVSTKIQNALTEAEPEVILSITADDHPVVESEPQDQPQPVQENNVGEQQLTGDMLVWHQNQIESAVQNALAEQYNQIHELQQSVVESQRDAAEVRRKLDAAEEIIEGFQGEVCSLQEQIENHEPETDPTLTRRYEAAVELLDAALERLPEIAEGQRRIEALESLLEAAVDRTKTNQVEEAVKRCLAQVPAAKHGDFRGLLEGYETPSSVYEAFKKLVSLSGTKVHNNEPLPSGNLEEDVDVDAQPLNESVSFGKRLHKRLQLAV